MGPFATAFLLSVSPVFGITVRDVIELSRLGVGDEVLIELIQGDEDVERPDAAAVRQMKAARVSEHVILAMLRASRRPFAGPPADGRTEVARQEEFTSGSDAASPGSGGRYSVASVNGNGDVHVGARATATGRHQAVGTLYPVPLVIGGAGHLRGADAGRRIDAPRPREPERPFWIVKTDGWIVR